MNEFKNLISLLESPNKENFSLGLQVAQNYRKEIFEYFGCELEDLEEMAILLMKNVIWKREGAVFDIKKLNFRKFGLTELPKTVFILKNLEILDMESYYYT